MSAAAGTTKKVRKSRAAKAQAQHETKQEYVKAEQGEDSSTPPLVVYPQTLVPSSVLDMISTPQHGKASNGVRFTLVATSHLLLSVSRLAHTHALAVRFCPSGSGVSAAQRHLHLAKGCPRTAGRPQEVSVLTSLPSLHHHLSFFKQLTFTRSSSSLSCSL
jgi:hypothetical protein